MNTILIDDHGLIWTNAAHRLKEAYAAGRSDDDIADYLVRNLGFAHLVAFGKSCQLKVNPAVLTENALHSVVDWLRRHRFDRYVMSWHDGGWKLELFGDVDLLAGRLLLLISQKQIVRKGDFIARAVEPVALNRCKILGSLLQNWPMLSGSIHTEGLRNILSQLTNGRYFLVRADSTNGMTMYDSAGSGFTPINNDWLRNVQGTPVECQPDASYGKWVAKTYDRILQSEKPVFEAVDAIVSTSQAGRYRIRYNRVLLPSRASDGSRWLLGASSMDNRIDLRLEAS